MLLNPQTTSHPDRTTPRFTTARLVALLLLFAFALTGVIGCAPGSPLGPRVNVSANPEQALKDGAAKVKVADEAAKVGSKEEAKKIYTDAVTYYTVAANNYKNTATGLAATMEAARIASDKLDQKQQAYTLLLAGLKTYPIGSLGNSPLPQEAVELYNKITAELDAQNSKTYYYMVMDALMKIAGNNAVLALFIVALAVTLLTWPLRKMVLVQSNEMKRFMPEMKKIQEKYKDDYMLSNEKIQEFNKKHGINPLAGCLPALAQWPITLLMYQVIAHYQFHFTSHHFLWINETLGRAALKWPSPFTGAVAPNLAESDLVLIVVYAASMFFQMRFTPQSSPDPQGRRDAEADGADDADNDVVLHVQRTVGVGVRALLAHVQRPDARSAMDHYPAAAQTRPTRSGRRGERRQLGYRPGNTRRIVAQPAADLAEESEEIRGKGLGVRAQGLGFRGFLGSLRS